MGALTRVWRGLTLVALGWALASCGAAASPGVIGGQLDLRARDWSQGAVSLAGEWSFGSQIRRVPDTWAGDEAGGPDGRGSGTYRLRVLVDPDAPPLALSYHTASTAMAVSFDGVELARVGNPDPDRQRARPQFAPGTVRLPRSDNFELQFFVSNHEYRTGGLWTAPALGPVEAVEAERWTAEAASVALATALAVIGLSSLLLLGFRRTERTFVHLGVLALLVALRSLVTGDYTLVRLVPGLPFEVLIRLEYLTAFLPLPSAVLFFSAFFPGLMGPRLLRIMLWPSWAFGVLTLMLPLDMLTRSIPWFYPFAVPTVLLGTLFLARTLLARRQDWLLFGGAAILAATGLADMAAAAFYSATGNLTPWGLGLFVVLQATTLARRFLAAFKATETLLAEKELLVREIHHRVKNSLQVVASLVSLQASRLDSADQKAVFRALRNRITAIALVHEKLYGQGIDGKPDLGEYLREMLSLQYPGDELAAGQISWKVEAEPTSAEIDSCIDAGLILTELLGNAHKHALASGRAGRIEVEAKISDGRLEMTVTDDGPGFPAGFRPEGSRGLGFRLILTLLQRNDGTLVLLDGPGARVKVDLRLPSASG